MELVVLRPNSFTLFLVLGSLVCLPLFLTHFLALLTLLTLNTCVKTKKCLYIFSFLSLLLLKVLILLEDGSKSEAKDGEGGEKGGRCEV